MIKVATLLLILSPGAEAAVPYPELNDLRIKSIVTRVASDNPAQAWVKKCVSAEKAISAGSALALAMDNAAAGWRRLELKAEDMPSLKEKISVCEKRGSCQVYDAFLNEVQAGKSLTEEILSLKSTLEKKMGALTAKSFAAAFKEIKDPCAVLKKLTR